MEDMEVDMAVALPVLSRDHTVSAITANVRRVMSVVRDMVMNMVVMVRYLMCTFQLEGKIFTYFLNKI